MTHAPLPLDRALEHMLTGLVPITETLTLPLEQALRHGLAEDMSAPLNVPPADNSAMDGYALRAADWPGDNRALRVSQRVAAGHEPRPLEPGTAARIFTGGEIPAGADTVAIQENCTASGDDVVIHKAPHSGDNIRRAGQDMALGDTVLRRGTLLRAQEVGLLASMGLDRVRVLRPLRVAVLTSGDELAAPGQPLQPGQIYNSNGPLLRALLEEAGCRLTSLVTVADDPAATRAALQDASAEADLILSCGGVSVGEEDHLKGAVEALGRLDLWKIAIKPGKPVAFGAVGDTPFLGLPGNPASVFATFLLVALPLLRQRQGMIGRTPCGVPVPARFQRPRAQRRTEYLRARLTPEGAEIHPNQSSGVLSSACWGDGLLEWPADTTVAEGDLLRFYPYSGFFA